MDSLSNKVEKLKSIELIHDVPCLTMGPISLNYIANFDSNFEDYAAFSTGLSRFLEESVTIKNLNDIVREGLEKHCSLLYSWRSLTRALPPVSDDNTKKIEMYTTANDILTKAFDPLFALYKFCQDSSSKFCSIVSKLVKMEQNQDGLSEGVLMELGRVLDMLSLLDDLRSAKTSVKNDLATYKRIRSIVKNNTDDPEFAQMIAQVTMFLAQPNEIMNSIKKSLDAIADSVKIIVHIIALTCERLENRMYITPVERYVLLRTVLAGLSLMVGDKNAGSKLEQRKCGFSRIDKIFKDTPSIPIIGDMHSNVPLMFKRLNFNFEWSLFDGVHLNKIAHSFNVTIYLDMFETEYALIISEIILLFNSKNMKKSCNGIYDLSPSDATAIYNMALKSLKMMGKWNYILQEVFFYKMSHPADVSSIAATTTPIDNYSLATRYNYNNQEKSAVARILFFIKSLCLILRRYQNLVLAGSNMHIYHVLQDFYNTTISEIVKKAQKSKNHLYKMTVESIKSIGADNVDINDSKTKKGEKSYILKSKSVSPLSSQTYMIKTMLNALLTVKDLRKQMDSSSQQAISDFINETTFHSALANFDSTLMECAQLNPFWFKEFYIEIAAGKHIQYPIADSFAWIIINYCIESNETNFYEFVLAPAEVYNDAAHFALTVLRRQHLYNEIEAEARLVFDQFCYLLSEKLYNLHRAEAFTHMINKALKNTIIKKLQAIDKSFASEASIPYQNAHQIYNLCKQRSMNYLGRSIDLNAHLAQRLLLNLKKSIEACINYFESSSLENIILLEALLLVLQQTHYVMSRNFDLPPFKVILDEVNGNIPGYLPRITSAVIIYILDSVCPGYSFSLITQRFVKSPISYSEGLKSDAPKVSTFHIYGSKLMALAFEDIYSLFSKYLGIEHFQAIFRLVGYSGITRIVDEIRSFASTHITGPLKQYVDVLIKGMPAKCILPRAAYGFAGIVQYYNLSFDSILKYTELRPGVIHNFRTMGNYVVVVHMLERAIYSCEASTIYHTSAFNCVFSSTNGDQNNEDKFMDFLNRFKYCSLETITPESTSERFKAMFTKSNILDQEKLCCGLSFFSSFLQFISGHLDDPTWKGPEPINNVISIDECNEFHRVFSVLSYFMTLVPTDSVFSSDYEFGDGFLFGGLAIITCLNQRSRYEALDFVLHAVSISDSEGTSAVALPQSFSAGTMRGTLSKKTLKNSETSKAEMTDECRKILSHMRTMVVKKNLVANILQNAFKRNVTKPSEVIKCFQPPVFTP